MADELIAGLERDYGGHPYGKWRGAHWRVQSLVDLGAGPSDQAALDAAEQSLAWLASPARLARIHKRRIEGRVRRCASQDGLGLHACLQLGMRGDPRLDTLAESLVETQWPDGGWNCDIRPHVTHSSFHESWGPILGLAAYGADGAVSRGAEFLLDHGVVFSHRTGELTNPTLAKLRYPSYWHYDLLVGLTVLSACGRLRDERAGKALALLESKRREDGTWHVEGKWWKRPGSKGSNVETVDWGERANERLTERARAVLEG